MINKKVKNLKFSGIANVIEKANKLENDVIRLEVGDVDLSCPEEIQIGIDNAFKKKKTHYPPLRGDNTLLEMLSKEMSKEMLKNIVEKNIIITSGGSIGMFYIFSTILSEGDEVIVNEPIWPHLCEMIKYVGAVPIKVGLNDSNNFHLQTDKIKEKITDRTKAILINTPNNPTGIIYSESELKELCNIARINDLYIISDEEYCDYLYNNEFNSPLKYYDKTLISRSFSKQYSIAGLRIGYVVADSKIIDDMIKLALFTNMYSSSIVQYAIVEQRNNMKYFIENANKIMNERMNILYDGINSINGLSCEKSEGGLYIWLNCKEIESDDTKFADRLLYNAHVATVPGSCFGESGKGYLRVSLGAEKERLYEAIKRIKDEVEK